MHQRVVMNNSIKTGAKLKQKRQEMGISQKKLAEQIGCAPSALCMFEGGRQDALSVERLKRACEILDLKPGALLSQGNNLYCPNPLCPTHHPYAIGAQIALKPEPVTGASASQHCGWCGEFMLGYCENCEANYEPDAAFCKTCGLPYVSLPDDYTIPAETIKRLDTARKERNLFSLIRRGGTNENP